MSSSLNIASFRVPHHEFASVEGEAKAWPSLRKQEAAERDLQIDLSHNFHVRRRKVENASKRPPLCPLVSAGLDGRFFFGERAGLSPKSD
jgi:hypothetical protein